MVRKKREAYSHLFVALFCAVVFVSGAIAFSFGSGANPFAQVAAGNAADIMCQGGSDAKCPCGKGLKNGKCDPNTSGGGKIGCPCKDITAGQEAASGQCAEVGKCLADKAGGMPPMLPMLPMPMPKMPMPPPPQEPCLPKGTTNPTVSGGLGSSATDQLGSGAPCPDTGLGKDISDLLTFGETTKTSTTSTSTAAHATTTEPRTRLVRFLESFGFVRIHATSTEESVEEFDFVPLRVVIGRDEAGHLRLEVKTIAYEQASTSEHTLSTSTRRFGQSTFIYEGPQSKETSTLARVSSTFSRMVDRMFGWMWR